MQFTRAISDGLSGAQRQASREKAKAEHVAELYRRTPRLARLYRQGERRSADLAAKALIAQEKARELRERRNRRRTAKSGAA